MPAGQLAHICLLVEDLDAAVDKWQGLLAVLDPAQTRQDPVRMGPARAGGDRFLLATFVSVEGCEIQLLQPIGEGPSAERLADKGEGVHHICFTPPDTASAIAELRRQGHRFTTDEIICDPALPWLSFAFLHAADANGVLVEVCCPYQAAEGQWIPAD